MKHTYIRRYLYMNIPSYICMFHIYIYIYIYIDIYACIYIYIYIGAFIFVDPIYPTPPLGQDMTQGQFFKRSLTGLNSEFFLLLD